MNAVIVLGRQVNSCKLAILKRSGEFRIASEKIHQIKVMAFSLKDATLADAAQLADGAIHRAGNFIGASDKRAGARFERAGKKVVEAGIVFCIFMQGFSHVDLIALDEPTDK